MWYTKIVEAGALDVLSGDLEIKENDIETLYGLQRLLWSYSSLPNFESIYKYFKSLLPKLISEKNEGLYETKCGTYDRRLDCQLVACISYLIDRYNRSPDDIPKANRLIAMLVEVSKILDQTPKIYDISSGIQDYFIFQTQNFIYNYGHRRLLNIVQEGVDLPFSVKFSIATNRDLQSTNNLSNTEERKQLKKLILDKDEFLQYFDADLYTSEEIKNNITKINKFDIRKILEYGALTIKDFENFVYKLADDFEAKKDDTNRNNMFWWSGVHFTHTSNIGIQVQFFAILHNIKNKIDYESYKLFYHGLLSEFTFQDQTNLIPDYLEHSKVLKEIIEDDLEIWKEYLNDKNPDFLLAFGIGSKDDIIKYFIKMKKNENFISEDVIPTQEEINIYESKNVIDDGDDEIGEDLFDKCVANGSATFTVIKGSKYEQIFEDIANALGYTENEGDILDFLKLTPLVIFNTDEFYKKLSMKKPPVSGSLSGASFQPLGFLQSPFAADSNKIYNLGIVVNAFKVSNDDKVLSALKIDSEKITNSIMAHEITHLLDVGIKGGLSVFGDLDPKIRLKKDEVYNKSRLYLSDIREIVARVYGNSSYIAQVLHTEVEDLRTNKDIREAAISELSDIMMRNPASWLNLTPLIDEHTLQTWAEMKFGPYQYSQNPYSDSTKTYLRQREKARDFFLEAGKRERRDILLKFIKEMNSLKRQLESVKNNTEESQTEIIKQLELDIEKVSEKIKVAQQGGYDYDINLIIGAVANYAAFKGISITNEIASDPAFDPSTYITIPNQEKSKAIGDSTPLSYGELKEIRDFDIARLSEGEEGGKSLREQKPSFMSFDIYNPEWREDFRNRYNIQQENEKTSFNYSKWIKK